MLAVNASTRADFFFNLIGIFRLSQYYSINTTPKLNFADYLSNLAPYDSFLLSHLLILLFHLFNCSTVLTQRRLPTFSPSDFLTFLLSHLLTTLEPMLRQKKVRKHTNTF